MSTPYNGYEAAEGDETTASLAAALGLTDFPTLGSAPAGRGGDGEGVGRGGAAGASAGTSVEQRPPPPPGMLADDAAADVYRYQLDAAALAPHGGGVGSRPASASAASAAAAAGVLGIDGGDWTAGIYRATAAGAQPHGAAVGSGAVGGGGGGGGGRVRVGAPGGGAAVCPCRLTRVGRTCRLAWVAAGVSVLSALCFSACPSLQAWWSVVDWPGVEKRYTEAVEENA